MANTAESLVDMALTASSDPAAPPTASASVQDLLASAAESVALAAALAEELVDVLLSPVAESAASMLAPVVVPLVASAVVVPLVPVVASAVVVPVVPVELLLLVALLPVPSGSVAVAPHSVAMAADVVSELDSEVASVSAAVPSDKAPSEQALEASLELELTPLP